MPPDSLNSIVSSFTDPTVGGIVTNILYSDNAENIGNKGEKNSCKLKQISVQMKQTFTQQLLLQDLVLQLEKDLITLWMIID